MVLDDAVSDRIMARAPVSEITKVAKANGLRLLREDGWMKVRRGTTTPEEVIRCTKL